MVRTLADILDGAAVELPNAVALLDPKRDVTYAQFRVRADQLAQMLLAQGLRRMDRVAIYMPRALETSICVHGVFRSGGAYLGIDPSLPADRVKTILSLSGARFVVALPGDAASLTKALDGSTHIQAVIGADIAGQTCFSWDDVGAMPAQRPDVDIAPSDLAYLQFTSGSTGTPKGVAHTHASGLAYAELARDIFDLTPADRLASTAMLQFDISLNGMFAVPLAGASLLTIPTAYTRLPASLSDLLSKRKATVFYTVPSAVTALAHQGALEQRDMSSMRAVLFGGEPMLPKHLTLAMSLLPQAAFWNVYGPSETNQCTAYRVPPLAHPDDQVGEIPIGQAWPRTEVIMLDPEDQIAPQGTEGELAIWSDTMMQGYWNRPELNKHAFFIRDKDGANPRTYYRSGDLARQDENGDFWLLGRKDRQVKINGYRVELDEIEQAIGSHPDVLDVGAYTLENDGEVSAVGASVQLRDGTENIDPAKIMAHASTLLPGYAVPREILIYVNMPRTSTGKVDRRRLKELALKHIQNKDPSHE